LYLFTGELDANRPVPFRLTPNIWEFITPVGVHGVITHSMIAVARCLVQPQFSINSFFKTILKDELIGWNKKVRDDHKSAGSGRYRTTSKQRFLDVLCCARKV